MIYPHVILNRRTRDAIAAASWFFGVGVGFDVSAGAEGEIFHYRMELIVPRRFPLLNDHILTPV